MLLFCPLLACLTACAGGAVRRAAAPVERPSVYFYLDPAPAAGSFPALQLQVAALGDTGAGDAGSERAFALPPRQVPRGGARQLFLGAAPVPSGRYGWVTVTARVGNGEWRETRIRLTPALELHPGTVVCVFVQPVPGDDPGGAVVWTARPQASRQVGERILALSREAGAVFVVRTDRRRVVAAYAYPGLLSALRASSAADQFHLLDARGRVLLTAAASDGRILDRVGLPLVSGPTHLAVAPQGDAAWVTDVASRRLLRLDLATGLASAQRILSHRPGELAWCPGADSARLVLGLPDLQQVALIDPDQLNDIGSFSVGLEVGEVACDEQRVVVADPAGGALWLLPDRTAAPRRVATGAAPEQVLVLASGHVLVSLRGEAGLALLPAGGTEVRRIFLPAPATALAESQRAVYAALPSSGQLAVLDVASEQLSGTLELGVSAEFLVQVEQ